MSTNNKLSLNRFFTKFSLSSLSLYAVKRFCICITASFPTVYAFSLIPVARSIYSSLWSSKILKYWKPSITWLSAIESANSSACCANASVISIVVTTIRPDRSKIHRSIPVTSFIPLIVSCNIWFEIILLSTFHICRSTFSFTIQHFKQKKKKNLVIFLYHCLFYTNI